LDLLCEFYVDRFEKEPLEAHRNAKGDVQFKTGDPVIDRWEQQLADGKEVDLLECFNSADITKIGNLNNEASSSSQTFGGMNERAQDYQDSILRKKGLNPF
jgi:hypothetical protein